MRAMSKNCYNKKIKNLYKKEDWFKFREKVLNRDNYQCSICGNAKTVLQVHHVLYHYNKKPWEYEIEDCVTLCKRCHAIEHGITEPTSGWELIEINDLGDRVGMCERQNCGTHIRYEHVAHHPKVGYRIIGSECIKFLTEEDKKISRSTLVLNGKIKKTTSDLVGQFLKKKSKNGNYYLHLKHVIREYETFKKYFDIKVFSGYKGWHIKVNFRAAKHKWGDKSKDLVKEITLSDILYIAILWGVYYTQNNNKDKYFIKHIIAETVNNSQQNKSINPQP